jgi:hypothetical protein
VEGGGGGDDDDDLLDPQCILADEDGNDVVFQAGDPIPFFPGACGEPEQWPTFCLGTDAEGGIVFEYPYCVYSETQDGLTVCATDGSTVTFVDDTGESLTCSCTYSVNDGPQSECVRGSPTTAPVVPTAAPIPPSTATSIRMDYWKIVLTFLAAKYILL